MLLQFTQKIFSDVEVLNLVPELSEIKNELISKFRIILGVSDGVGCRRVGLIQVTYNARFNLG
jgi:hypothetical protein